MLGRVGKNPGGSFGARVYTPPPPPPPPKKKVDITKTSSNDCLEYIFVISGGEGRGRDQKAEITVDIY